MKVVKQWAFLILLFFGLPAVFIMALWKDTCKPGEPFVLNDENPRVQLIVVPITCKGNLKSATELLLAKRLGTAIEEPERLILYQGTSLPEDVRWSGDNNLSIRLGDDTLVVFAGDLIHGVKLSLDSAESRQAQSRQTESQTP